MRRRRWDWVILWTLIIYSTLYIVRPICDLLRQRTPFELVMNLSFLVVAVIFLIILYKKRLLKRSLTHILLIIATLAYIFIILKVKRPEEKIHFLEYSILGFLAYQAFLVDVKGAGAYLLAFILAFILGWVDEGIQHILPNRYYDIRDVTMNGIGGGGWVWSLPLL